MSSPKHLWSGDWERESADAAATRGESISPVEPASPAPTPPPPPAPSRIAPASRPTPARPPARPPRQPREPRPNAPTPTWLQRRVLLLAVIGAIVLVGGAWALSSSGGSSGAPQGPLPYLGMNLQNVPVNRVIVESVVPGSPADQAGIGPGDLLLSVNGQQVGSPADVDRILAGLHPGDSVTLQLQQGPVAITAQVQLADPPAGTP